MAKEIKSRRRKRRTGGSKEKWWNEDMGNALIHWLDALERAPLSVLASGYFGKRLPLLHA